MNIRLGTKIQRWKSANAGGVEDKIINPSAADYSYDRVVAEYAETLDSKGFVVEPKTFLLAWTHERIELPVQSRVAARVEGESALARLGIGVRGTPPTIHSEFTGQIQLAVFNHSPLRIRLVPGLRICQLIFERNVWDT